MTENAEVDQPQTDDPSMRQMSHSESEPDQPDQADEVDQGSNREAAKYRRRLRDTEAERDRLADQLATARKAVVEAALDRLPVRVNPELIWMRSAPGDYFTEDGTLNRERLELIVDQLRKLGAAQVKGWHSGEGREPRRPVGRSARDRATRVIMGRLDE